MVFEDSQLTCAAAEIPVFGGLLMDMGQRAKTPDCDLGPSSPKLEKLYARHTRAPEARVVRELRVPRGLRRHRSRHSGALAYHIRR